MYQIFLKQLFPSLETKIFSIKVLISIPLFIKPTTSKKGDKTKNNPQSFEKNSFDKEQNDYHTHLQRKRHYAKRLN